MVTQLLCSPVPHHVHGSGSDLRVAAHDGHAGSKRAVDTEDDELCSPGDDGEVAVGAGVVAPGDTQTL